MSYYVYMLRCRDGSLYTGYTDDPERRVKVHNSGRGAKYTRSRLPVELVYREELPDRSAALRREWELKRLTRAEKLKLIQQMEQNNEKRRTSIMSLKECIHTSAAPAAVGPYSQAVAAGPILVTSGQIPLDPSTGKLVEGGIRVQTEQVLRNIEAILAQAGLSMDNVIKTTVFLTDINDFAAMNEVYAAHFQGSYPARSAVEVGALPKGAKVEIETICVRG